MSYYPIQLDKTINLKYGMRAISLIEKKFKRSITQVDMDNLTMEDTAVMIWAGLHHEDKNLDTGKVMDLVDEHSDMITVVEAMGEALQGAFGNEEPKEAEAKNE